MRINKEKIVWGVVLLGAGAILLLRNMGLIDFYWSSVFRFWPVIIILIGFNMLIPRSRAGNVASVLVTLAAVAFLAYAGMQNLRYPWGEDQGTRNWFNRHVDRSSEDSKRVFEHEVTHEFNAGFQEASLTIRGGAVSYEIEDPTEEHLFWSKSESVSDTHVLDVQETAVGTALELLFHMKDTDGRTWTFEEDENEVKMRLHPAPVWAINLQMGAGEADFDLRKYTLNKLHVACGAASVKAKLGAPKGHVDVHVESGAASIKLEVPRSAACRIEVTSALSSRSFKGFTKQSDGSFTTPNYDSASDRYDIKLEGGMSTFTIERKAD